MSETIRICPNNGLEQFTDGEDNMWPITSGESGLYAQFPWLHRQQARPTHRIVSISRSRAVDADEIDR